MSQGPRQPRAAESPLDLDFATPDAIPRHPPASSYRRAPITTTGGLPSWMFVAGFFGFLGVFLAVFLGVLAAFEIEKAMGRAEAQKAAEKIEQAMKNLGKP